MQHALRSKESSERKIKETARAYFSHCPFCNSDHSLNYEKSAKERVMSCNSCRRRWSIRYNMATVWFLRSVELEQKKKYTMPWMLNRVDRSLQGIRSYLLFENDYSKVGKEKVVEQGVDRLVWEVDPLLDYFDRYDRFVKRHPYERIKIAFACARINAEEDEEEASEPGLSIRQVAAVTNLPEYEASKCTRQLLDEGVISYEIRPEKSLTGVEAVIAGFLGEPLYQMNEHTAEKVINRLTK